MDASTYHDVNYLILAQLKRAYADYFTSCQDGGFHQGVQTLCVTLPDKEASLR